MKLMRMREFAAALNIPISTVQKWVEKDPELSILKKDLRCVHAHWIKLDKFAGRQGITLPYAYMLASGSVLLVKAVELAAVSGISRKTVANWCKDRTGFALRFGRIYYIDLNRFGASEEEAETLYTRILARRSGQTTTEEK